MFFEIYKNQAATQPHGETVHMKQFRAEAARFFVGDMVIDALQ